MIDLSGKVALVTGAARGLGRADCLALARAGADVAALDVLDPAETAAAVQGLGRRALALRCDITDRAAVRATVAEVQVGLGGVHILVNNAATLDHIAQIEDQIDAKWDRDMQVNLTGAYNCSKAVWPLMKAQQWGRIISMSSVAGTLGGYGQASYSSTKAGLIGLMKTLALEGARHNITANTVVGGLIATEAYVHGIDARMKERMERRTPFRRPGRPEDVANAICFLASDLAGYITGAVLPVAGGIDLFTF